MFGLLKVVLAVAHQGKVLDTGSGLVTGDVDEESDRDVSEEGSQVGRNFPVFGQPHRSDLKGGSKHKKAEIEDSDDDSDDDDSDDDEDSN